MKLTWREIEHVLVAAYGDDGRDTVAYLQHREAVLNCLNQCGDVNRLSGPIDGGLVAMDCGEVVERD